MGKLLKKEMGKAEIFYEEVEGCTPENFRQGDVDELKVFNISHITLYLM